jgi:hypothetical protein
MLALGHPCDLAPPISEILDSNTRHLMQASGCYRECIAIVVADLGFEIVSPCRFYIAPRCGFAIIFDSQFF